MQEVTFAAPKAGPKSRPAAGREEAAAVAPVDRRSPDRGREDDFGSVVDAEERAAAKKPADDAGKAEAAQAAEAGSPTDEDAAPDEASALRCGSGRRRSVRHSDPGRRRSRGGAGRGRTFMVDAFVAGRGDG